MGAIISLAYMMTKIGEYFYPKESAPPDLEKGPKNIIVNIGEYNCHFDYKLMEGQTRIASKEEENKYIEAEASDSNKSNDGYEEDELN